MKALACRHCFLVFKMTDAMGKLVTVTEPTVEWDKSPRHGIEVCCPQCASSAVDAVYLCADCKQREPSPGDDFCMDCRVSVDQRELYEAFDYQEHAA